MATRKRTGKKPKSKINPLIVVLTLGGVLIIALVIGLLVAKSAFTSWLHGDGFQEWLTRKAGQALHSKVEIAELRWQGKEVYSNEFTATGYEDAGFAKLHIDGLRASTAGIADKAIRIPGLTMNRLEVEFSKQRLERPEVAVLEDADGGPGVPDALKKYMPERVEVDEIGISSGTVLVKNSENAEVFSIRGMKTTIEPDFMTGLWEVAGSGGKMLLKDQPEMDMKDLKLRWKKKEVFVDNCEIGIYKNGHVSGAGEISFEEGGLFDFDLDISGIDIDELVKGEWQERLSGIISGPVKITGVPGNLVYEGKLNVSDGIVESVPALKKVADYTQTKQFNRLVLSQATADVKRTNEVIEVRNIVLQADGLIRVEGAVDIRGNLIQGALQVGVTPGTMRWIPGAEQLVFTEDRDGFLWTPLALGGTIQEPTEDLSGRLINAAGEAVIGGLPPGVVEGAKKILGSGENSDELIKQGKKLLDMFGPLLNGQ
ncbi:hypothetical protein VSU19_07280 [Verrucomicrobiales bacterium BCK34]|nr:hypothetical protein [Verrucomicrobiales bacterium BCK34]